MTIEEFNHKLNLLQEELLESLSKFKVGQKVLVKSQNREDIIESRRLAGAFKESKFPVYALQNSQLNYLEYELTEIKL